MSTKKKALLTYQMFALVPQVKMMVGFSIIMTVLFSSFSSFVDIVFPYFLIFPVILCLFFVITVHKERDGNWEKYTRSLPISTKEIVQVDYIYILVVAVLSEFFAFIGILSIQLSKEFELDSDVSIFCVGIVFFYAVLPKIYEVEQSHKKGVNTPSFTYFRGFIRAIMTHIALFFATMIPLGFMSDEGIYFTGLLCALTLALTLESYKKSLIYAEYLEF